MERTLVLIRHAKSDWNTAGQADFDRALNDRGKKDAPVMGLRLKDRGLSPDLIIASPAKRAATTAKLVGEAVGYRKEGIHWVDRLYHCPAHIFEEVIAEAGIKDEVRTVYIFAHNPGITHFANETLQGLNIDNIPTCGVVAIAFDAEHWSDYPDVKHTLLFFDYPKNK